MSDSTRKNDASGVRFLQPCDVVELEGGQVVLIRIDDENAVAVPNYTASGGGRLGESLRHLVSVYDVPVTVREISRAMNMVSGLVTMDETEVVKPLPPGENNQKANHMKRKAKTGNVVMVALVLGAMLLMVLGIWKAKRQIDAGHYRGWGDPAPMQHEVDPGGEPLPAVRHRDE